jgi:hypothetical protein
MLSVFFLPTAGILEPNSRKLPQARMVGLPVHYFLSSSDPGLDEKERIRGRGEEVTSHVQYCEGAPAAPMGRLAEFTMHHYELTTVCVSIVHALHQIAIIACPGALLTGFLRQ